MRFNDKRNGGMLGRGDHPNPSSNCFSHNQSMHNMNVHVEMFYICRLYMHMTCEYMWYVWTTYIDLTDCKWKQVWGIIQISPNSMVYVQFRNCGSLGLSGYVRRCAMYAVQVHTVFELPQKLVETRKITTAEVLWVCQALSRFMSSAKIKIYFAKGIPAQTA